jgi:hypothetical protein
MLIDRDRPNNIDRVDRRALRSIQWQLTTLK